MPDREKVIKALECCGTGYYGDIVLKCYECLYGNGPASDCRYNLHQDALALLKEQEAKQVNISQTHCGMKYGLCPRCEKQIDTLVNPHYCGNCGQAVKWE